MKNLIFDIYCDESRQDLLAQPHSIAEHNRFCCIGGLMVPVDSRQPIKNSIKELQKKHNVYGELRWGTVSHNKIEFYCEIIDLFFSLPQLTFRTIVIDATKVNNHIFNHSDQELGYYKFYYQLLTHWITPQNAYRVYTDQKTNRDKNRLKELQRILNLSIRQENPIKIIQAIDSKESLILQLENIIMGATGYRFNYENQGTSSAKMQIVSHIETYLGHKISPTPASEPKFNVFAIELKEAR